MKNWVGEKVEPFDRMHLYISILWQWPDDVAVTFYMFMFLQIIINSH